MRARLSNKAFLPRPPWILEPPSCFGRSHQEQILLTELFRGDLGQASVTDANKPARTASPRPLHCYRNDTLRSTVQPFLAYVVWTIGKRISPRPQQGSSQALAFAVRPCGCDGSHHSVLFVPPQLSKRSAIPDNGFSRPASVVRARNEPFDSQIWLPCLFSVLRPSPCPAPVRARTSFSDLTPPKTIFGCLQQALVSAGTGALPDVVQDTPAVFLTPRAALCPLK